MTVKYGNKTREKISSKDRLDKLEKGMKILKNSFGKYYLSD